MAVVVARVDQRSVPLYFEAVGQTEASETVDIRARVQGFLTQAPFKQGSLVKSNDLLFQIDSRPFQAALDQANAELAKALASLEKSRADVSRLKPLVAEDAVPRQDLDNAEASLKIAEGNLSAVRAAVASAELNVSFTTLHAPFNGMVGGRLADVGNLVGTPDKSLLATISTVDPMRVSYTASETDYLRYVNRYGKREIDRKTRSAALEFELTLADGSVFPHKGRFDFVERALDSRTGTIKMRVLFPNPDGELRPGQFVRIRVKSEDIPDALLVPQKAVTEIQSIQSVFVVTDGNLVQQRSVELGDRVGNDRIIKHGLNAGERIIIEGAQKARAGIKVNPVEQPVTR